MYFKLPLSEKFEFKKFKILTKLSNFSVLFFKFAKNINFYSIGVSFESLNSLTKNNLIFVIRHGIICYNRAFNISDENSKFLSTPNFQYISHNITFLFFFLLSLKLKIRKTQSKLLGSLFYPYFATGHCLPYKTYVHILSRQRWRFEKLQFSILSKIFALFIKNFAFIFQIGFMPNK